MEEGIDILAATRRSSLASSSAMASNSVGDMVTGSTSEDSEVLASQGPASPSLLTPAQTSQAILQALTSALIPPVPAYGVGRRSQLGRHVRQRLEQPRFTLFPKLPLELRLNIWEATIPETLVVHVKADKSFKKVKTKRVKVDGNKFIENVKVVFKITFTPTATKVVLRPQPFYGVLQANSESRSVAVLMLPIRLRSHEEYGEIRLKPSYILSIQNLTNLTTDVCMANKLRLTIPEELKKIEKIGWVHDLSLGQTQVTANAFRSDPRIGPNHVPSVYDLKCNPLHFLKGLKEIVQICNVNKNMWDGDVSGCDTLIGYSPLWTEEQRLTFENALTSKLKWDRLLDEGRQLRQWSSYPENKIIAVDWPSEKLLSAPADQPSQGSGEQSDEQSNKQSNEEPDDEQSIHDRHGYWSSDGWSDEDGF
ncbi:hypothetical protein ONS95_005234 [Cadophora gregata]|uniref:uncharacterized protein n=1 Tax=Cadophora gregata TaxID=51156 RepID=UPI0026DCC8E2|nr:uncharacterized protein ONS95_005234 [Cadophora gregata]KAK0104973.1 hypothetical protein ONS95_005234 [Cadophora gregata]KAK0114944.1 hypothetical protein ONS96_013419 [Cadophora gregata f. sp. sojae]